MSDVLAGRCIVFHISCFFVWGAVSSWSSPCSTSLWQATQEEHSHYRLSLFALMVQGADPLSSLELYSLSWWASALLPPSPLVMRGLLRECGTFASEFELTFNASKTQLVYFKGFRAKSFPPCVVFGFGLPLSSLDRVNNLRHILHALHSWWHLSLGTCRKANYLLHVFTGCDSLVK